MDKISNKSSFILGFFIFLGLSFLGYFLSDALIKYKQYDRLVSVKGLSQKDVNANMAIWPIRFIVTSNDTTSLYKKIEEDTNKVLAFLYAQGIKKDEITINPVSLTDRLANDYSNQNLKFRYFASRNISIYSKSVDIVRNSISKLTKLGKEGVLFKFDTYDTKVEYIYTKLNEIKPLMIQEATKNARAVALKFAKDSNSKLGKIKNARQGQFSIQNRDKNTPYIKKVRVVSTVEYYLSD